MKGFTSFFAVFSLLAVVQASNVLDLDTKNFDKEILESGKPALVKFFAPWCGHCRTLSPTYEQLADTLAGQKTKVTIAKVDVDDNRSLGDRFGIKGFPTIMWFNGKSNKPTEYASGRDLESLQDFISEQMGTKQKVKETPSNIITVTDADFASVALSPSKYVFVKFYAPWCGHCKSLAPTWEIIATNFKEETNVVIAKINCDSPNSKATAEKFGIDGYPTLMLFSKGSTEPFEYVDSRSEAAITDFINAHAGTHRAVGGGLKETAGRIEALDHIVGKAVKGKEASIFDEVNAIANRSEEKYAVYYAHVLTKIGKSADYVQTELRRVQGMVRKGGLTPSKLDDLTIRQNILKQFYIDAEVNAEATPVAPIEEQAQKETASLELPVKDEL